MWVLLSELAQFFLIQTKSTGQAGVCCRTLTLGVRVSNIWYPFLIPDSSENCRNFHNIEVVCESSEHSVDFRKLLQTCNNLNEAVSYERAHLFITRVTSSDNSAMGWWTISTECYCGYQVIFSLILGNVQVHIVSHYQLCLQISSELNCFSMNLLWEGRSIPSLIVFLPKSSDRSNT